MINRTTGMVIGLGSIFLANVKDSNSKGNRNRGISLDSVEKIKEYAHNPALARKVDGIFLRRVERLPEEIVMFPNIEFISVTGYGVPFKLDSAEIEKLKQLPNLKDLKLSDVNLESIPLELTTLPLTNLNLRNNKLTTVPTELGDMPLDFLFLSGNPITNLPQELVLKLSNHPSMVMLGIDGRAIDYHGPSLGGVTIPKDLAVYIMKNGTNRNMVYDLARMSEPYIGKARLRNYSINSDKLRRKSGRSSLF